MYHSIYDSEDYSNNWMDRGHLGKLAMTQYWGYLALQLADMEVLPFNFSAYAERMGRDLGAIKDNATDLGLPSLDWSGLSSAVDLFRWAAGNLSDPTLFPTTEAHYGANTTYALNTLLHTTEQQFISLGDVFPGRVVPWYTHVLDAPGLWAGYAAQSFPGIFDAMLGPIGTGLAKDSNLQARGVAAQAQIGLADAAVTAAARNLWAAVSLLRGAEGNLTSSTGGGGGVPPASTGPSTMLPPNPHMSSSSPAGTLAPTSAPVVPSSTSAPTSAPEVAAVTSSPSSSSPAPPSSSSTSAPVVPVVVTSSSSSNGTITTDKRY